MSSRSRVKVEVRSSLIRTMKILNFKLVATIVVFCFSMGVVYGASERNPRQIAKNLVWNGWYANAIDEDPRKALRAFDEAERLYPQYGWTHLCRGDVLAEHYSKHDAMSEYDKAIALGGERNLVAKARVTKAMVAAPTFDRHKDFRHQVEIAWGQFEKAHGRVYKVEHPDTRNVLQPGLGSNTEYCIQAR